LDYDQEIRLELPKQLKFMRMKCRVDSKNARIFFSSSKSLFFQNQRKRNSSFLERDKLTIRIFSDLKIRKCILKLLEKVSSMKWLEASLKTLTLRPGGENEKG